MHHLMMKLCNTLIYDDFPIEYKIVLLSLEIVFFSHVRFFLTYKDKVFISLRDCDSAHVQLEDKICKLKQEI